MMHRVVAVRSTRGPPVSKSGGNDSRCQYRLIIRIRRDVLLPFVRGKLRTEGDFPGFLSELAGSRHELRQDRAFNGAYETAL